jgi:hypothetical protein
MVVCEHAPRWYLGCGNCMALQCQIGLNKCENAAPKKRFWLQSALEDDNSHALLLAQSRPVMRSKEITNYGFEK